MSILKKALSAVALIVVAAVPAHQPQAQSLKDKLAQQEAEKRLNTDHVASTNSVCGTGITARFDWPSFNMKEAEKFSIPGYCGASLDAIRDICGTDLGKQAVAGKIKTYVCRQGDDRKLELKPDGTLEYSINFKSSNDYYYATDWLKDNL